jgi:TRAP-type transport system periplasmic protein
MNKVLLPVVSACLVTIVILGGFGSIAAAASAKPVELVLSTWSTPSVTGGRSFVPFAKEIEEKTGGRYKIRVAWGASLGKTAEHYDLALKSMADIAMFGPSYTTGRFPMEEIVGLPIHFQTGEIATKALLQLWKKGYFAKELSDVKVLYMWSLPPYHILWGKKPASTLADIKNKKVRSGGGVWTATLNSIGAIPVGMAPTELYDAMSKGTIDGTFSGYGTLVAWKLIESVNYVTELGVGSLSFGVVMNKRVWDKLPKDVQAVFDSLSDKYSQMHCAEHIEDDAKGKDELIKRGAVITTLSPADKAQFTKVVRPVITKWVADGEAKGLPAKQELNDLQSILKASGVQDPFAE